MIYSKPSDERGFRDHDLLIDKRGRIYVVVGNKHPPGQVIAYVKYVPTSKVTQWRRFNTYYERVLKRYDVKLMRETSQKYGMIERDPIVGAPTPKLPVSLIREWLTPETRMAELLRTINDVVEEDTLSAAVIVADASGISLSRVGVTGSVLAKMHSTVFSDVNLVVYGCREAVAVATAHLSNKFDELPKNVLEARILRKSRSLNLPPEMVASLYPPYARIAIKDRPVGITFVSDVRERYGEEAFQPIGVAEVEVYVEPWQCSALFYPGSASISAVINVCEVSSDGVGHAELARNLDLVVTYEGLFNYTLFKGGRLKLRGVLERIVPSGSFALLLGGAEEPGYALPV